MKDLFNEEYLVHSSSYRETMNSIVLPWLDKIEHACMIPGYHDRPLYSVSYDAEEPVGTVLIVHGFTENALKYAELIWSLLHLHFSVVVYDQRGHGRSWRSDGIPDPSVTHVDSFTEYVEDLHIICDTLQNHIREPLFVFGHSMGGAVVSLFLEQYPCIFHAAVLSSPMIAPNLRGVPVPLASMMAGFARLLGKEKKNPFFMSLYAGPEDFSTSCATDQERFAWYDEIKADHREFQNSVPSYRWSAEAMRVTKRILSPGNPEKISCPVLLFTSDQDRSVLPGPQQDFISRIPQGRHVFVKDSRHEIYRSENKVLYPWWHQVISFYLETADSLSRRGGTPS